VQGKGYFHNIKEEGATASLGKQSLILEGV